jgi:predicted ATPase
LTSPSGSASLSVRGKVSTGYGRLDEALQGGFLDGSTTVLSAVASDEVPILLRNFLASGSENSLLICRTVSSAETLAKSENVKALVCSDKPVSPAKNIIPGKGIENLTELNLAITDALNSLQPKKLVIDTLSDILLRHKALQTRKWLTELLERLRAKGITTLAVLNPYMHAAEESQAVTDIFDGNLEINEKQTEEGLKKFIRIKWMHGIENPENEFLLVNLVSEPQTQRVTVRAAPLKEPRWLTPLINRSAEFSKLKESFANALTNKASVVTVQGEAGVGKTRLMQELAVFAQPKDTARLTGGAREEKIPYGPWVELLREYVGQASGEVLRRMLGGSVSEFAKLIPDISAKVGTVPPSKPLGEEQERIRLYDAIAQFLIAICIEKPLLLLFDDMQWADQASLDLLEYFVRSSSNLRVLTLVGYRTEDVSSDNPLSKMLMKLNRERLLETVQVRGLNKEDTTNFIKQVFGEQTVSTEFVDLVFQRTGGNPFFVEEVLRSLVEDGTIYRTEKGWDRKPLQELVVPDSVKVILRSRLTKLGLETLVILQWAAVAGSEFNFELLEQVSQLDQDTLLQRIEAALAAGIILEAPREKGNFRFADNRLRELLLDDLSRIRQAKYHLKIAEALEKLYSKNLERHAEALAYHYSEGGTSQLSIKYSGMAGDRNRSVHAYEQAINDYRRALDLLDLLEGGDRDKATFLEKLANCYVDAGKLQAGSLSFEQALAIFEKLNDRNACARAYIGLAKAARAAKGMGPGSREAILILRRGLKFLGEDFQSFEVAWIYSKLSEYHGLLDEWDEANACAEKALAVGDKTQNFGAVAEAISMKASFLTDTGKLDEGLPLWKRAFDLSLKHEHFEEAMSSLHNLSVYTYQRDLAKAREFGQQNLELSSRVNHILRQAFFSLWLSYINWLQGNWTEAIERSEKAFEIKRRLNLTAIIGSWDDAWKGWLLLSTGQLEQAETEIQKALGKQEPKITFIVAANLVMGMLRIEQGREDEARKHLETCVDTFRSWEFTTMPLLHVEALLHLTSIHIKQGEPDKALETSQLARRIAEQLKSDAGLAMAFQAEAGLLAAQGKRNAAEEAYTKSLALWEKAGWPYYGAKARVAYSEALTKTSPEESLKQLKNALEVFQKLGAKRDLEKVQAKVTAGS